ncbi:MAG TPA: hypothetical protein VI844_03890 [Coxiellaceae bacterium]|nr:hypothetical protein [Coxiellaceae bacterium]
MRESESLATNLLQLFDAQLAAGVNEADAVADVAQVLVPDLSSSLLFIPNVLQAFNNQINNHLIHDPKHFSMLLDLGRHLLLVYFSDFNEATMKIIGTVLLKIALLVQIIQRQEKTISSPEIQVKLFNIQGAALGTFSNLYNLNTLDSKNLIDAFTAADVLIHYLNQPQVQNDLQAEEDWHSWTRFGVSLFQVLANRQDIDIQCLGQTIYTTWNFFEVTREKSHAPNIEKIIKREILKIINRFCDAEKLLDTDANIHHTNFMHNVYGAIVRFRSAHALNTPAYTRKDAGLPPKYKLRGRVPVPALSGNAGELPTPFWKQAQEEARAQKKMAATNQIHPPQASIP